MAKEVLLSILIPSIPSRFEMLRKLVEKLEAQIGDMPVQIISCLDNKMMSIGEKRDILVQMSKAVFVAFVDEDDDVNSDYISELVSAIGAHPDVDVVTFKQQVFLNDDQPFVVSFGLQNENEQSTVGENGTRNDIKRKPYHVCAWRRELAKSSRFPHVNYGEDSEWLKPLWEKAKSEHHIDRILQIYRYSDATTEAK